MTTEKESSIIIALPHMVDLALGSPEVGAVNFNVLHSLLHVIIQQMNLMKTQVEFRGPDCDRIRAILQTAPPSPILKLSQYTIAPEDSKANLAKKASRERKYDEEGSLASAKKLKEGEVKKDDRKKEDTVKKKKEENVVLVQQSEKGKVSDVVERVVDKEISKKRVSKEDLNKVEEKVSQLERQVIELQSLPSNEELINRSRSSSQTKPLNDMWLLMNLTKRVDAAELCINKLTSMVEDLAKDTAAGSPEKDGKPEKTSELHGHVKALDARLAVLEEAFAQPIQIEAGSIADGESSVGGQGKTFSSALSADQIKVLVKKELNLLKMDVGLRIGEITAVTEKIPYNTFMDGIKEIDDLRARFEEFAGIMKQKTMPEQHVEQQGRINELEEKLNMCEGHMEGIDTTMTQQMDTLHNQIADLEKEFGEILEKVNTGTPVGGSFSQDYAGLSDLYSKIQIIQGDMENLNQTATRLMDDREERQLHIEALLEQIDVLKNIKADREDLEEALADKADHNTVNRKVSHDQFDAACDDLSRGLEEALAKLTQQETVWQQALDDIQREIENKLDKIEISPLKDFVNSKLKILQEKLKVIANMRKESEAAGTKLKLLRNVNCISCDKEVVMKTKLEVPSIPAPEPMPPSRSMRAYLTYELDQIRKQQRRPPGKNLMTLEEVQREQKRDKDKENSYREMRSVDHLCNRYCGGSHTITTPQQRVAHIGHFLTQWGPQAIGLSEGTVRGTDGNMYRARAMPTQKPASVSEIKLVTKRKTSGLAIKKKSSLILEKTPSPKVKSPQQLSSPARKKSSGEISPKAGSPSEEVSPGSPKQRSSVEGPPPGSPKRESSVQEQVADETTPEETETGSLEKKTSAGDTTEEMATGSPQQIRSQEQEVAPSESSVEKEPQEQAAPGSPEPRTSKEMSPKSSASSVSKESEQRELQEVPSVEHRASQEVQPAERRASLEVQPAERRASLEVQPAERRASLEVQPAERRASLEVQPAERRASQEVQPAKSPVGEDTEDNVSESSKT